MNDLKFALREMWAPLSRTDRADQQDGHSLRVFGRHDIEIVSGIRLTLAGLGLGLLRRVDGGHPEQRL
jgi:hypothetical protein